MLGWYKGLKNEAANPINYQFKMFVEQHLINENIAQNNYMVEWIRCVKEIKINRANHKMNNIRKFVITKRKSRKKGKDKEEIEEVESENEYFSDNSE